MIYLTLQPAITGTTWTHQGRDTGTKVVIYTPIVTNKYRYNIGLDVNLWIWMM